MSLKETKEKLLSHEDKEVTIPLEEGTLKITPGEDIPDVTFEIAKKLSEGTVPTNEDLENIDNILEGYMTELESRVSGEEAQTIIHNTTRLMENARKLREEKNYDGLLQSAIQELVDTNWKGDLSGVSDLARNVRRSLMDVVPKLLMLTRKAVTDRAFRDLVIEAADLGLKKVKEMNESDVFSPEREDVNILQYAQVSEEESRSISEKTIDLIQHIRSQREYKDIVDAFLHLLGDLEDFYDLLEKDFDIDTAREGFSKALEDISKIIERTSHRSPKALVDHLKALYGAKDDRMFSSLRYRIREIVLDPHQRYTSKEELKENLDDIYSTFEEFNKRHGHHISGVLEELRQILEGISEDPSIQRVNRDWSRLSESLLTKEGDVDVQTTMASMKEISISIMLMIKERLETISFPKIELETPKYLIVADNISISPKDIFPNTLELDDSSHVTMNLEKGIFDAESRVSFRFSPVDIHIEEMDYYFKKKHFVKFTDYGTVSIDSTGGSIEIATNFNLENGKFEMNLHKCEVNFGKFSVDFLQAKHEVLDNTFKGIFRGMLRSNIEKSLETSISSIAKTVYGKINEITRTTYTPITAE